MMILTIGGKNGAGKSTLSRRLAEKYGLEIISIGNIKRALAQEMGLTISEFDKIGRDNPEKAKEFDLKYEDYQKSLDPTSHLILDSRMSFWCQPTGFNVFLDVDDVAGAKRIFDEGRSSEFTSLEEIIESSRQRHEGFKKTYMKLYSVDIYDFSQYDLVIDTTSISQEEVFNKSVQAYDAWLSA